MIEFDDITLLEANGNFDKVVEIMSKESFVKTWMIKSQVFVHSGIMSSVFVVNFWNDRKVIIDNMFRPAFLESPNEDIAELSEWTKKNGWLLPEPSTKLIESPSLFLFWKHQYQSGLISCSVIEKKEKDLLDKIYRSEKKEQSDD